MSDRRLSNDEVVALATAHPEWFGAAPADDGWVTAALLGNGESFDAWLVSRSSGSTPGRQTQVVLRHPRRGPGELPRPMQEEFAALALAPFGLAPEPVALHPEEGQGGEPAYMVVGFVPGQVRPAAAWTDELLAAHAGQLALLHERQWPRCGEVVSAADNTAERVSLVGELAGVLGHWGSQSQPGTVLDHPAVTALRDRMQAYAESVEPVFAELDTFALVHGDAVLTNILVGGGVPRYVDWEWTRIGDPARDLGFIGGVIHAEPWYLPLSDDRVDAFLQAYLDAGGRGDLAALRVRRDAWLAAEAFGVICYLVSLPERTALHEVTLTSLQRSLDTFLP